MDFVPILPAVVLGAVSQRVTGLGFALVVAPFLLIAYDPVTAVIVVNLCGALGAIVVWARTQADVDWRRYSWLAIPAAVGIVPGTVMVVVPPRAVVEITAGLLLILALVAANVLRRTGRSWDGPAPRLAAGFASGFMNSAVGAGGPAVTVYAVLSAWDHRSFAATMQPYLITVAGLSLLSKAALAPQAWPALPVWLWLLLVMALAIGLVAGEFISRIVRAETARSVVVVIAYLGASATIAKGVANATAAG